MLPSQKKRVELMNRRRSLRIGIDAGEANDGDEDENREAADVFGATRADPECRYG